ncbi:MAG: glycosyltransferase [Armatimonadetes bacterium]|nr:glycosyltransferase [Armatimonadota bacterium]
MRRRRRRTGNLGVVLGEFPSISETFILREMLELERRGFRLTLLALEQPSEEPHADTAAFEDRTFHRPRPLSFRSLISQAIAFMRFPGGYISALSFVTKHGLRHRGALRELVSSLLAAGYFATRVPRSERPVHVHAQFASAPATTGLLLAEIIGVTFSMSAHARDIFTNESILLGVKLSEAEFTAVCTQHGFERLQRQNPLTVGDRLHLIHHGVDITRFIPRPEPREKPPLVISVGRLVPKKGMDILLRAAAIARSNGAEFRLEIVGDGPEREDLERLTAGLGLRDVVKFHGTLTQEQLAPVFARAHAFALACIVTEDGDRDGIPNALIEALALGVPAVATSVGGIPELIEHEQTGLLARPGHVGELAACLERIIYDDELRATVSNHGRGKVEREFDIARNIEDLAALLRRYVAPREAPDAAREQGRSIEP